MKKKESMLKDFLLKELREYFGVDTKRINHAEKVLDFTEMLLEHESADWTIVVSASILHDVGIKVAEEKYGSASGHYQEKEGPEIARSILLKTGLDKKKIDEICQIIGHHHSPGKINTRNFMVLYDADWLVNLKDEVGVANKDKLKQLISKIFLTRTGKLMAEQLYL